MSAAPVFHDLKVETVERLTDDAVAVTFGVPDDLVEEFVYTPGQHVVVRTTLDGEDVRRTYSICANANSGQLRIGVKRLHGGLFSTWINEELRPGDVLSVMPPIGEFTRDPDQAATNHYCAIVAGSGITPVLSLVATTLETEKASSWTVVYGNRQATSVMFLDELEGLKDRYPDRLAIVHVLSREDTGLPITSGRIDRERLELLFGTLIDVDTVDHWYLCGPYEMVTVARQILEDVGTDPQTVHDELFFAGPPPTPIAPPDEAVGAVEMVFTIGGRASTVRLAPETTLLDAALSVRTELPYSCRGGMCATCKAHVVEGAVEMERNWALTTEDLEAGFTLTCQARPTTDRVVVDFDHR